MQKTETKEAPAEVKAPKRKPDPGVDEYAQEIFADLGFKGTLPGALVTIYNDYKRTKDTHTAGRLSAEGFATVVTLYRLLAGDS